MNKTEIVNLVADSIGMTKKETEDIVNKVLDTIIKTVSGGDRVTLVGFGSFEPRNRKARTGRNPKTNELLTIPAKRYVGFKVGKEFSQAVNNK